MISTLGQYLICLSILFGLLCLVIKPRIFLLLQTIAISISCILLLYAFITNDFSVQNVFLYSSTKQPLAYKIASLWANHNSSLLFLITLFAIVTTIAAKSVKEDLVSKIFAAMISIFALIIYLTSSPFGVIKSMPHEGLGMNPVLQDMAITIHPPMLYLGYVVYSIPFGFFLAMLLDKKYSDILIQKAFYASKLALTFLTIGISLGSWWAYRELGWGGYWFFDPVENISLIPWLIGLALHHCFILYNRKGSCFKSIIALGITNMIVIILGILLVRSGALISVHSFASNIRGGVYIMGVFIAFTIFVFAIYISRISDIEPKIKSSNLSLQDKALNLGSILVIASAIFVWIGTLYPIIYQFLTRNTISISVRYFYITFIPLGIIIVILASISPHITNSFKLRINAKNSAMMLSHSGVLMLAIGVFLNAFLKQDFEFIGKIGDSIKHADITISLQNIRYSSGPNYYRQIGEFWVDYKGEITILKPENRLYKVENSLSAESDIYSFIPYDIYAVLGNVEKDNTMHANIYIRPWMSLIWGGMALVAIGIVLGISRETHRSPLKNAK